MVAPSAGKPAAKVGISALAAMRGDGESAALRKEVATLKEENAELKLSRQTLAKENQTLKMKLERLELIFESSEAGR